MAQEFSFDITCGFDKQEFANAIDQAKREIMTRYDFKGVKAEIEVSENEMTIHTESEFKLQAVIDLIESKLVRRNVPLTILDKSKSIEQASGGNVRQKIGLVATLTTEQAKEISKAIRADLPKVRPNIQGESVRVVSKSKDDLQETMQLVRSKFPNLPLQFGNYH